MSENNPNNEVTSSGADFAKMETPDELKPRVPVGDRDMREEEYPPPVERQRPVRPPLVQKRVWVALAVVLGAVLVGTLAAIWLTAAQRVVVPDVVGVDVGVARTRLAQIGLEATIVEERFSAEPIGEVLEQRPGVGAKLKRGRPVGLVVSAGTEEFVMPDVIGDGLTLARGTLEAKGLVVEVEVVTSDQSSDTVLASTPAAGALVRIGDTVRLQVATPRAQSTNLRPYRLQGLAVTIDPAPSPRENVDVPLEIARRLRALLEASDATVVVLRSSGATATSDADRAQAAIQTSSTVAIGLSVNASGPAGRSVAAPLRASTPSPMQLRDAIASQLATAVPPAVVTTATVDPVLGMLTVPWARVTLGSYSARNDETAFSDPNWADDVARAIYVGIGEVFGSREGL